MASQTLVGPSRPKRSSRAVAKGQAPYRAAERISDLIGSIYDCALDPGKWEATLADINREFAFLNSALGIVSPLAATHGINAAVGFDPEWQASMASYVADSVALWGGAERMQQFPLDEPILSSQLPTYGDLRSNRYYREVLEPRGMLDTIAIAIAREPNLVGYVAFNRHISEGPIGEDVAASFRVLGPHFRRAATISNLFDLKAIEASTFASALDSFAFAVVLVDEHLAIVHANAAARTMVASKYPIRSDKGVLALPSPPAHGALERAVRLTAGNEIALGARGIGIPVRRGEDEPSVVHVLPLRRGEIRRGLAQRATAALFITPASTAPRTPADALAVLYDLTPAEVRVLDLLAAGKTQAAIGQTLGIARSTVKSHVLHLFDKTGCRRQVDLVRLVSNLSLPT